MIRLIFYASAINYCQLVIEEQAQRVKKAVAAGKFSGRQEKRRIRARRFFCFAFPTSLDN